MTQWYVKDLSKLTKVSVQTLHHYDRIGLLNPSVRLENGYRLYSEMDLLRLQQIIALKFFGFGLKEIKKLLNADVNMINHFKAQAKLLDKKATALINASKTLKAVVDDCNTNKSITWEDIIETIEVYRMTKQLEKNWTDKIFNSEELQEYIDFKMGLNERFSDKELQQLEQEWEEIKRLANTSIHIDPTSTIGIRLGQRCMSWVNRYYGNTHYKLRKKIWQDGYVKGNIEQDDTESISAEGISWLDQAISAYQRGRIIQLINQIGLIDSLAMKIKWEALVTEMHGDDEDSKKDICKAVLRADDITPQAKEWMRDYIKKFM